MKLLDIGREINGCARIMTYSCGNTGTAKARIVCGERNRGRFESCHTRQTRIIRTRPKRRIFGVFSFVVFIR